MCIGNINDKIYQLHYTANPYHLNIFFILRIFFGRVYINQIIITVSSHRIYSLFAKLGFSFMIKVIGLENRNNPFPVFNRKG